MSNHTTNFKHGISLLSLMVGLSLAPSVSQAQDAVSVSNASAVSSEQQKVRLNQAELDQMLAPIALYPDTLLSHILVAATYPLEIIQAARWRDANQDLDEEQALNAVEDKDWDPSVKALVPFNDLLQKFSEDLDWLQALGDAFLSNEEQVLAAVQNLRQKAYAQGNLQNNEYIEVAQDKNEITIQTVRREVIYVPYYDTRVVYGNWWWDAYPPYYWHSPRHYVWHNGFYWSPRYYTSPAFYYGGFRWHERYVYVDYDYRSRAHHSWTNHSNRQVVRSREYSRWQHDESHRRGVHYSTNGRVVSREYSAIKTNPNRFVTSSTETSGKKRQQIDKKRELDLSRYPSEKSTRDNKQLPLEQRAVQVQEQLKVNKVHNDKQRLIDQSTNQQRIVVDDNRPRNNQVQAERQRVVQAEQHVAPVKQQRTEQKAEQRQYQRSRESSSNDSRQRTTSRQNQDSSRNRSSHSNKTERKVKD